MWDSRRNPPARVHVKSAVVAVGGHVAGVVTSCGVRESVDLRGRRPNLGAMNKRQAVDTLSNSIVPALVGIPVDDQTSIDDCLTAND